MNSFLLRLLEPLNFWMWRYLLRTGAALQCSDAPDVSGINAAAVQSSKLGADQFAWFTKEYERTAPEREATAARDAAVADAQVKGMNFATDQAQQLADRNKTVFQPLEDKIVTDAQTYDTAGRRTQAVNEATADVEGAFGRAQDGLSRGLARMGVAPGGGRSTSLMQDAALKKATAIAGASTGAVKGVEQQGYARMQDAAALGKGLIGNQGTQQQIATQTGGAATAAGAAGLAATQTGANLMQAGFSGAMQGQAQAGSLYGQAAGIQSQARGQDMNLLGTAFSAYMKPTTIQSDENIKIGTGKVTTGRQELAEVNAIPVEKGWRYDPAKGGPDDGGQLHTGPMAQKVRAKMGEQAAPSGVVIDMRVMGGKLMAATQALSRDVATLKKQVARMSKPAAEAHAL